MHRIIDIVAATVGLIVLSPALLLIALAVSIQDGGPVFYRAKRAGRNGSSFRLLKFRTMVPHADRLGGGITLSGDGRVTPVGGILRKFKLDELPQLWNVVKGEMSLVGPRPEDPRYVALYQPAQRGILAYTPGITSPASLSYRNEQALLSGPDWQRTYLEEVLPRKIELDMNYFANRTVGRDLLLIGRTISRILT